VVVRIFFGAKVYKVGFIKPGQGLLAGGCERNEARGLTQGLWHIGTNETLIKGNPKQGYYKLWNRA